MKKLTSTLFIVLLVVNAFASGHTVTLSGTNASCHGVCDGQAIANVSGGVGPFAFSWDNSATVQSTATVINLCVGTYIVIVTDSSDMSMASDTISILEPGFLNAMINTTGQVVCVGACMPMSTSVTGGTAPYQYSWDPSPFLSSTIIADPLLCPFATQNYVLTVTDANGCISTANAMVFVDQIFASTTSANTSCVGSCNGSATVNTAGGNPPYTYSWNDVVAQTSNPATNLCAGTYTVTVIDVMGCMVTANPTILEGNSNPPTIVLDTLININCSGSSAGTITVHGTGGIPPYSYLWSNGSTVPSTTNNAAGTYIVSVSDSTGCNSMDTLTVQNFANLYASMLSTNANCSNNGTATVIATGAHPPYTYQWNDASNQTNATATNLAGGVYTVSITDSVSCTISGNVSISFGCYNAIKGKIYADTNQDCSQQSWEQGIQGVVVTANPGPYYGNTDANGNYTILTPNMNNTVSVSANPGYTLVCPASGGINANFTQIGDTLSSNDFAYYQNPASFDLGIHPGWTNANPGFPKTYWFLYWNNSTMPQNALVRFVYDSVLQYTGCTAGGVHFPAQHKIEWTFNNLAPGSYWDWNNRPMAFFDVPVTVSVNDLLQTSFEILPIAGDTYPEDNVLTVTEPVTGSHDPNSKSVIPKGQGANGTIFQSDSVLLYPIHFQNNGNDTAHFVIVKDTLSQYLDPASIVPGASSHPYTFDLSGSGILTFTFNNIMLPDSTTDEPASNGYFNYTIKQKANNPIGTVIANRAGIYFDFNLPVITNTTINTIVDVTTGITSLSTNNMIKVFPNPFSDNTTFVIQSDKLNENYSFEMTDVLGKKVKSVNGITNKQFEISRNGLENGIYFYKICTSESTVGMGKLVIK